MTTEHHTSIIVFVSKEKYLSFFIETVISIKTKKEMREFFEGILTSQELIEIPTRLQIVKKLKEGISQHEIAKELRVGVATVTRGSKELQKGRFGNV